MNEIEQLKEKCARQSRVINNISDGWHTFEELYEFRKSLSIALLNTNKDISWKSKKHHDGSMFNGGYFICGIETPNGQVTNHYKMDSWDLFNVKILEFAPEWDGHTAIDSIDRLKSLKE